MKISIVDKIKHLLNKTIENGCTEEEAKTAFALARKLMIKHKIDESMLNVQKEEDVVKEELNYDFNELWIYNLLHVFLDNFGTMYYIVMRNDIKHVVLFGTKIDVDCVKTLFMCAYEYVKEACDKYCNEYLEIFGTLDSKISTSYINGFINGLYAKYDEQNKILNNQEALMVIPNDNVKTKFNEVAKNFEQKEVDYTPNVEDIDYLAISAGYRKGKSFGTIGINMEA